MPKWWHSMRTGTLCSGQELLIWRCAWRKIGASALFPLTCESPFFVFSPCYSSLATQLKSLALLLHYYLATELKSWLLYYLAMHWGPSCITLPTHWRACCCYYYLTPIEELLASHCRACCHHATHVELSALHWGACCNHATHQRACCIAHCWNFSCFFHGICWYRVC